MLPTRRLGSAQHVQGHFGKDLHFCQGQPREPSLSAQNKRQLPPEAGGHNSQEAGQSHPEMGGPLTTNMYGYIENKIIFFSFKCSLNVNFVREGSNVLSPGVV
jgi:hypothetical protein